MNKCLRSILLQPIGLLICFFPAAGQVTFQKYYGNGEEVAYSIREVTDGFVLTGTTGTGGNQDILVIKTDFSGSLLWSRTYGGQLQDDVYSMDKTQDNGFILAGYSMSFTGITPNEIDFAFLMKIDSSGNLQWSRIIDVGGIDVLYDVQETSDHGFIMTGSVWYFSSGPKDLVLIKTDSTGVIEWSGVYGTANSGSDEGRSVIQTRDGGYAVVGMSDEFSATDTSLMLLITNPSGAAMYGRYYKITNAAVNDDVTYAHDLIQDQDGNLLVTGGTGGLFQNLFYAYSPYLLKTDSTGNFTDCRIFSLNSGDSKGYSVEQSSNGGYLIGGTMGNYYPFMLLTDPAMNTVWSYYYASFGVNAGFGFSATQTTDGGFALGGYRTLANPGTYASLIKTDGAGLSGCNESIPALGGNASTAQHTLINGTVFSIGSPAGMNVQAFNTPVTMSEYTICASTGILEYEHEIFSVSPNPAIEETHIHLADQAYPGSWISLTDATGRLILEQEMTSQNMTLPVSKLSNGIYLVTITLPSQKRYSRKLAKW